MPYLPIQPKTLGRVELFDIDLREIVPFINWTFFFSAWRLTGKYKGIEAVCSCPSCETAWLQQQPEEKREKAAEALKLFRDAQEMLRRFLEEKTVTINAVVSLYPAHSVGEDIAVELPPRTVLLPMLRQQHPSTDGFCYSLADFVDTENDFIGAFACTVISAEKSAETFDKDGDIYHSILIKTVADRLAEAAAEWLHYQTRTRYWGYSPDEKADFENIKKGKFDGIRPAVGYPSLPDQSVIFCLDELLEYKKMGIQLTENGAMFPNASVSGLYFAHPKSKYFAIGKICDEQLNDYAKRCGKTKEEMRKWLTPNLVNE